MSTLGDLTVAKIDQSGPPKTGAFIYIDISSIDNRQKRIVEPKRLPASKAPSRARQRLQPGDVLVSMTRPNLNAVSIVPPDLNEAVGSTGFHVLRAIEGIEPRWLFYAVQRRTFIEAMSSLVQGALYPAVRPKDIRAFGIDAPPLGEQQRIVAEIEKQFSLLDEAVANLKRVKANLKRYKAAVLKAAVEGKLTEEWRKQHPDAEPARELLKRILAEREGRWNGKANYKEPPALDLNELGPVPEGWAWATLEQLTSAARVICYGILMPKEHVPNGVLYVKVKDMKGDRVGVGSLQRTSPKIAAAYARASLKTGDLLLAIRGTYGRVAEVPAELDGGNITQDTARLDVSPLVDRRYVAIHLRSQVSQGFFRRAARGVAVKGVNIGDVRLTPIAVPPLNEQKQIVAEVDRRVSVIDELESVVYANLVRAERWRQSALTQAFNGRLLS